MNNGFVGLLRNELMKIYRRPRTWILLGVMVVAIIVTAVITQQAAPDDKSDGRCHKDRRRKRFWN